MQTGAALQKIIWKPLPGLDGFPSAQELAMSCPCNILLFDGSRGPGKTEAQLMKFRARVGMGYGSHWRGIIFDRTYKGLDDVVIKSERVFPTFNDGVKFLKSKADYKWVWPTGEELLLRRFEKDSDYWGYHGQEYTYIAWNELTKFPTPKPFKLMLSCNRSSFVPEIHSPDLANPLPPIPLEVFATTNPWGPGHGWVKRNLVDPAPAGVIHTVSTEIFNPRTRKQEVIKRTQVRLFGSYKENSMLPPEYIAGLHIACGADENLRKAWLEGDWNIVAGGALADLWKEHIHVIPRFKVPADWRVFRAFDHGSTHPFSVGWYCVANGEEVLTADGRYFCPRPGSVIKFAEWYGAKPGGDNEGLQLSSPKIAHGIIEREMALLKEKWITVIPEGGPADNAIFARQDGKKEDGELTIADKMEAEGISWGRSHKAPGSRKSGLQVLRDALEASILHEGPGFYVTDNCRDCISLLPGVPRDPEKPDDVDTDSEDHIYDETRYALTSVYKEWPKALNIIFPT